MKTCSKCKTEYHATGEYFTSDKRKIGGLGSWCRECKRRHSVEYRRENREKCVERNRKYRHEHPEQQRDYHKTIAARIGRIINNIKARCYNFKANRYRYYGAHGVTLEFTRQELEAWLLERGIDPRGLAVHRKDANKNYTLDNIELLTKSDHDRLHCNIRKEKRCRQNMQT